MALTSHNTAAMAEALFDEVQIIQP
jgi:hypothetical protein